MSSYNFIEFQIEKKLRNRKISVKLDGYDADTVIMALKKYTKELKSVVNKLLEGDSISVYSETVKRLYSAEFLADRIMGQVDKAIIDELKEDKERYKYKEDEK